MSLDTAYTEPTTRYWQSLLRADDRRLELPQPYRCGFPVRLVDGRGLALPLRALPDGRHALASFLANQASFVVVEAVAEQMAALARTVEADVVVGLPTLGLALAPLIAQRLGHDRFVPFGYSRKFWYRADLGEPVRSITSPDAAKDLLVDPNLAALLLQRRVIVVDDAVSSGTTMGAALRLLARLDARVVMTLVAMKQTRRWEDVLRGVAVRGVFGCPLFERVTGGWAPVDGTTPAVP